MASSPSPNPNPNKVALEVVAFTAPPASFDELRKLFKVRVRVRVGVRVRVRVRVRI